MKIRNLNLANNILLAPMAGITDLPSRLIARQSGVGLAFTEMVSANGLIREGIRSVELLRTIPEDRPLGIQLFGEDPAVLAEAARMVEGWGDLLDINMGCPVKKVVRSGAGSALMQTPQRVAAIVAAVRQATAGPLTVKLRAGWDAQSVNFLEVARIAVAEGADAVILHPRTRSQAFSGQADWRLIAELKTALPVPVIGSGDIFCAADGLRMLRETGCDGIMVGRGSYGNPWLIRDLLLARQGRPAPPCTARERLATAQRHLQLTVTWRGPRRALLEMRKHLCWYVRGLPGAATFRIQVNQAADIPELMTALEHFFRAVEEGEPQP